MKKALVFITVFCLIMTMFADTIAAASYSTTKPPLSIQILGKKVTPAPILYKDKVFVPLRATGQALGYQVIYSEKNKTMDLITKTHKVTVTVGYAYAKVNGASVKLDIAPVLSNGSLYVPLTFVQKNFKYDVKFIADKNMVVINKLGTTSTPASTPATSTKPATASNGIFVLDKKVNTVEKAVVKNSVVFIPLRMVGEGLGYKVSWSSSTNTMTMTKTGSSVTVAASKSTASINKQSVKLDGAPYLLNGRLYAPLSMISKNLGYVTNYDKTSNNVTITKKIESRSQEPRPDLTNIIKVSYDDSDGISKINISADRPITSFNDFTMTGPNRLVIDLPKAFLNVSAETLEVNEDGILRVRTGQLGVESIRLVVDLQSQKTYKILQSEDLKTITVVFANFISPITYSREGNIDVITVTGSTANDVSYTELADPRRVVLDINGAILSSPLQEVPASSELLYSIRIAQYQEDTARVVLDVTQDAYYKVTTLGNVTKIYLSGSPFDFAEYKTYYNTGVVTLNPNKDTQYTVNEDTANNVVNIVIPQDLRLQSQRIAVNDNLIKYIDIATQDQNGSIVTTAAIKMQDSIVSEVISSSPSKFIKIRFKRNITSLNQLTIVVDAGHGGTDPGALAYDKKLHEKDLNLDVALRVDKILRDLGFNTIMTRRDDTFIKLTDRADIANRNYADFFLSIHFNAYGSTANGLETLYYPNTVNADYNISNKKIADIFHKEMLGALGRASRGVTPRPNLVVLNKTKMPAILAELGFITNPEELAQIKTDAYKEKAARSLAVSIIKYFRDVQGVKIDIDLNSIYQGTYMNQPAQQASQPEVQPTAQQVAPVETLTQPAPVETMAQPAAEEQPIMEQLIDTAVQPQN